MTAADDFAVIREVLEYSRTRAQIDAYPGDALAALARLGDTLAEAQENEKGAEYDAGLERAEATQQRERAERAEAALRETEQVAQSAENADVRADAGPFPSGDQVRLLADATEHLLCDHDCDHMGWEMWNAALAAARIPVGDRASESGTVASLRAALKQAKQENAALMWARAGVASLKHRLGLANEAAGVAEARVSSLEQALREALGQLEHLGERDLNHEGFASEPVEESDCALCKAIAAARAALGDGTLTEPLTYEADGLDSAPGSVRGADGIACKNGEGSVSVSAGREEAAPRLPTCFNCGRARTTCICAHGFVDSRRYGAARSSNSDETREGEQT